MMLSKTQRDQLAEQGFLALDALFTPADVEEVRALLDPLFDRFTWLPPALARDLGAASGTTAPVRSPEINRPTLLEPRLERTAAYRICRQVARQISGRTAAYTFDHAIYKAPHSDAPTPWHQDQAYNGHRRVLRTLHFWIPLQEVSPENGCMHFVPGSHRSGLVAHVRRENGHLLEVERGEWPQDWREVVACPLAVGGVTIHTPLTLHYTSPNRSSGMRRAWILHFGPGGRLAKLHPSILRDKLGRTR